MTPPAPTPALARLRAQFAPSRPTRLLVHLGTCGLQAEARELIPALREVLGDTPIVESTCDGACWAAPAVTVQRDGHAHRFARLDRGIPGEIAECVAGRCDDEYAGRGERGVTARLGRTDGSIGEAIAHGAYAVFARVAAMPPARALDLLRTAATMSPGGAYADASRAIEAITDIVRLEAFDRIPGAVAARHLAQGDPHRLIEGALVAARAAGVDRVRIETDRDAPLALATLDAAVRDAAALGLLDGTALGGTAIAVEVATAAGRPASPALGVQAAAAPTTMLDEPPPPTRLVSLFGAVARPGLYEVPVEGIFAWSGLLALAGTNPAYVPGLVIDGPSGHLVRREAYESPLTPEALGAGSVLALPSGADLDDFEA